MSASTSADRPDLAQRLAALSREVGADILVNVDARRSDRPGIYKSSVLVGPDGPTGDRYDKMRLVPFGEYIPARSLLGWATSVGKAAGEDRRQGTEQVVMDVGHGLRVGPMVCFESAFPDMSRHLAEDGAEVLVAQSSTSTFQRSWAPEQHASLAALRAAETGADRWCTPSPASAGRLGRVRRERGGCIVPLANGHEPRTARCTGVPLARPGGRTPMTSDAATVPVDTRPCWSMRLPLRGAPSDRDGPARC